ncbi:hypothetical protein J1605_010481 [Eschrichtius robustus]|uniref:Uncharacterized protein n=1 Tax=Eschrichtius robustus TaxID=9764 RepID=A0AB34GPG2_ESCRO|nr:hypothetical protein J1605_010481 [Eschrichtius robustus]
MGEVGGGVVEQRDSSGGRSPPSTQRSRSRCGGAGGSPGGGRSDGSDRYSSPGGECGAWVPAPGPGASEGPRGPGRRHLHSEEGSGQHPGAKARRDFCSRAAAPPLGRCRMNGRTGRRALRVPGTLASLPPAAGPRPCAPQPAGTRASSARGARGWGEPGAGGGEW